MRELSVYYCPKCGFYAYYQISKNAVCHRCHIHLEPLSTRYQDFMCLDYEDRDRLISRRIIESSPSLSRRISDPEKMYNQRRLIGQITAEFKKLEDENARLNDTIDWMHKTIWEQLRRTRELEQMLEEAKSRQTQKMPEEAKSRQT